MAAKEIEQFSGRSIGYWTRLESLVAPTNNGASVIHEISLRFHLMNHVWPTRKPLVVSSSGDEECCLGL
jgi:hypothetical protein